MKEQTPFTGKLEHDLALFKDLFRYPENRTLLFRVFETPSLGAKAAVLYIDGVADTTMMENAIIEPMLQISSVGKPPKPAERADFLIDHILKVANVTKVSNLEEAAKYMLNGFAVILAEGCVQGITAEVPGFAGRPVMEAKIEQTVKGPKESFTESMAANRSLIRKYMRDHRLMCEELTIGAEPEAKVSIMYMDQIVDEEIVQKVKDRIKQIESEEVANLTILEKHIEERPYSLLPSVLATEKPDRAVAFLQEGHVILLMDNSPNCLIAPITFWSLFHTGEDQYLRLPEGNFIRLLRLVALFVALLTPSVYISVSNFHPEMLPTDLMLAIAATRERVPFPTLLEVVFMEVTFEILRESAVRAPQVVGPSIGIVGALILGQAAVDANIVSPILVIIVAVTGLSSFIVPGLSLNFAVRIMRFVVMAAAAAIGFYGVALFMACLTAYLVSLKSFDVPFFSPLAPHSRSSKDIILIPPIWKQWQRPANLSPKDPVRRKNPKGK